MVGHSRGDPHRYPAVSRPLIQARCFDRLDGSGGNNRGSRQRVEGPARLGTATGTANLPGPRMLFKMLDACGGPTARGTGGSVKPQGVPVRPILTLLPGKPDYLLGCGSFTSGHFSLGLTPK